MSERGLLSRFDRLQLAWNKWARSLSKHDALSCDLLVMVRLVGSTSVGMFLLVADMSFKPLAQTFVVCSQPGAALDERGLWRGDRAEAPFVLELLSSPTRLSAQGLEHINCLRHATSDEVLVHVVSQPEPGWEVVPMDYALKRDCPSLRHMCVKGFGEPVALDTKKKARVATEKAPSWIGCASWGAGASPRPQALRRLGPRRRGIFKEIPGMPLSSSARGTRCRRCMQLLGMMRTTC